MKKLEFKHFSSLILGRTVQIKVRGPMRKAAGSFCERLSEVLRNVPYGPPD